MNIFTYAHTTHNDLLFVDISSWDNKYLNSLLSPISMKIIVLYSLESTLDSTTTTMHHSHISLSYGGLVPLLEFLKNP